MNNQTDERRKILKTSFHNVGVIETSTLIDLTISALDKLEPKTMSDREIKDIILKLLEEWLETVLKCKRENIPAETQTLLTMDRVQKTISALSGKIVKNAEKPLPFEECKECIEVSEAIGRKVAEKAERCPPKCPKCERYIGVDGCLVCGKPSVSGVSEEELIRKLKGEILMDSCPAYTQHDYEYQSGVTDEKYRIVNVDRVCKKLAHAIKERLTPNR